MHAHFHSQRRCKDEIARELLADTPSSDRFDTCSNGPSDTPDAHPKGPSDTPDTDPADAQGPTRGLASRNSVPSFCNDESETDVEILTGGAQH